MRNIFALLVCALFYIPIYSQAAELPSAIPAPAKQEAVKAAPVATDSVIPQFPTKPAILEVVHISGEIDQDMWKSVRDEVKKINDSDRIKAVLLVVDSPGGGVVASEEIREELGKLRVPVVAFCNSICASGGEYILMNKSIKYYAVREATIAGSIGVFVEVQHYDRLLTWAKVDTQVFKSGDPASSVKDSGDPTQPISDADSKFFQNLVNSLATRFYTLVTTHRKISDLPTLKTATIFIGSDAVKEGLADGVMSYEQAEAKAKQLSGAKAIYTLDEMQKMAASVSGESTDDNVNHQTTEIEDNLNWAIGELHSIANGQSVQFKYELPYKF